LQDQVTTTKPSKVVLIAGIIIAIVFSLVFLALLSGANLTVMNSVICSRLIYWAEVIFLWWFAEQYENQPLLIWQEKRSGIGFILLWTVILILLFVAAYLMSGVTAWFGYHVDKVRLRQTSQFITGRYVLITYLTITAGVTEEIILRGYILTRLSLLFKDQYTAVIISALIFSGLHYSYNSARQFVFTFLAGLITALHYKKYGNLKPLILAHFLFDWAASVSLHYFV
jgi:membrane protease YdiL (CAAX protease family)